MLVYGTNHSEVLLKRPSAKPTQSGVIHYLILIHVARPNYIDSGYIGLSISGLNSGPVLYPSGLNSGLVLYSRGLNSGPVLYSSGLNSGPVLY